MEKQIMVADPYDSDIGGIFYPDDFCSKFAPGALDLSFNLNQ